MTQKTPMGITSPPKAIIYIRVSTGPQEAGTSLESQFAACQAKALSLGAQVVGVHQDVQSGADYLSRQGLQKALVQIENGDADTLIIYDMSRYSRDSEHQQLIKKRVLTARARLVFCTLDLGDLASPEGGLAFGVTGIFAEYERHKIKERTTNGSKARAKSGIQPSRAMRPVGYTIVNKEQVMEGHFAKELLGTYQIIEKEAEIVREIFRAYANGESLRGIGRLLARQDAPTARGGQAWNPSTIRYILQNPTYKGTATYGRHAHEPDETRMARGLVTKAGRRVREESEWILISAPPIIEEALWNTVQKRLASNQKRLGGNPQRKFMLSGLLRCPNCGGPMGGNSGAGQTTVQRRRSPAITKPRSPVRRYRCRSTACPANYYNAKNVEALVLELLQDYASKPELLETYYREKAALIRAERPKSTSRRAEIQRRLKTLEKRRDSLIEGLSRSIGASLGSEVYKSFENKLLQVKEESDPLIAELETLQPDDAVEHSVGQIKALSIALASTLHKMKPVLESDEISPADKHDLLSVVISKIDVPHKTGKRVPIEAVTIHFKLEKLFT
jgi:site-specific DNA recombinase